MSISAGRARHFDAVAADGDVLGHFEVHDADAVRAVVEIGHEVAQVWSAADSRARLKALRAWRGRLWRASADIAGLLHRETGVELDDAMLDVVRVVEHLKWVESDAARVLGDTHRRGGLLSPDVSSTVGYAAEGVVGIVVDGRPSLYATFSAVTCALAAGNAVVLNPGRRLTATASAVVEAFVRPGVEGVLQLSTGDELSGVDLAGSTLDRLCYLGPPVGAVKYATAAARAMVPVTTVAVLPPITLIAPDGDVEAAARSVLVGAGDGEQEVFVAPVVREEFEAVLTGAAQHDEQARGRWARALSRGRTPRTPALGAAPGEAHGVPSSQGTTPSATPGVVVQSAPAFDAVVDRVRAHPGAEVVVWSRRHGDRLAELLSAADVSVNPGLPARDGALPRAAIGVRGYGPFAGDDGLRTFARARTTTARRRLPVPTRPVDLLLATPGGRLAARLAMHLRHSLD
ncbi:aldehyde dehydrogenase family protein [Nocardioides sp. R-C-SC26]|uniref:aldehyde dehydrogenase family protein n=1 Tax=Nocardioides sp. R-C-SC26 TaxID=2870414 RepID=UPI001E46B79D|nr:aldehyde dehydrogenase family protein [Nocardioides sp. R-C-SC26]